MQGQEYYYWLAFVSGYGFVLKLDELIKERNTLYKEKADKIKIIEAEVAPKILIVGSEYDPKIEAISFQIKPLQVKANRAARKAARNMR